MNKKLLGVISLSFSAAFFAIGVNETIYNGIGQSYFLFMFSLAGLFGYGLLRNSMTEEAKTQDKAQPKSEVKKKTIPSSAKKKPQNPKKR